jgi:hypothetical protein
VNSTTRTIIGFLIIGFVVGIVVTLSLFLVPTGKMTSITTQVRISTSTVIATILSVVYSTNTSNISANISISLSQIEAALNYSSTSKLNMTSYAFEDSGPYREQLIASLQNVGSEPLIVSPNDCLLNGTFHSQNTTLAPSGQVGFGTFTYVPPKGFFVVEIVGLNALPGYNSTLQIYDNSWSLKYGTSAFS